MSPEVSVVIPAYNAAAYLAGAVDSVLAQTFGDRELVVVDDGSTDATPQVLEGYGSSVRVVRQANQGVAAARNRGLRESRGRWVAFLDADDQWAPDKLARQVEALRGQPGHGACATRFTVVDEGKGPVEVRGARSGEATLEALLLNGNVVGTPSTVISERTLLEACGGFDPALSQCADWDLWIRVALRTAFVCLEEPLVAYRRHGSNMSRSVPLLEADTLRLLDKAFGMPELPEPLAGRRNEAFAQQYMVLAGSYFRAGMHRDALRCGALALRLDPRQSRRVLAFPWRALGRVTSRAPVGSLERPWTH
jgi:glycosyltransferase involved in cell wall biosynthesis